MLLEVSIFRLNHYFYLQYNVAQSFWLFHELRTPPRHPINFKTRYNEGTKRTEILQNITKMKVLKTKKIVDN